MDLQLRGGNEPETARWVGYWNKHPRGWLGYWDHGGAYCCEGHLDPREAVEHGAALETERIMAVLPANCAAGTFGHDVLAVVS